MKRLIGVLMVVAVVTSLSGCRGWPGFWYRGAACAPACSSCGGEAAYDVYDGSFAPPASTAPLPGPVEVIQ